MHFLYKISWAPDNIIGGPNHERRYVRQAAALGIQVHTFLTDVPNEALLDPSGVISTGIALAKKFKWHGYNIDGARSAR